MSRYLGLILIKFLDLIDKLSIKPSLYVFMMAPNEQIVFTKYVSKSTNYLEFGSGGSTFKALELSATNVFSIESSKEWITTMKEYIFIRWHSLNRLRLIYVNIGKTSNFGYPTDFSNLKLFEEYSKGIFVKLPAAKIDTVLIDGRFRVACTLQSILNLGKNKDLIIMIHDFWNRKEYHIVLKYLEVAEKIDSLAVLKLKNDINLKEVENDYNQYKYNTF
jgi:hypothetical protein